MRILQVIPQMESTAGAETSLCAVDPLLVDAGFEIHLAVLTEHHNLVPGLIEHGVSVHDLSGNRVDRTVWRLMGLVRRLKPDLIHASLVQAAVPSQFVGTLMRVPVLTTWASTPTVPNESDVASWKVQVVRAVEIIGAAIPRGRFHAVTEGVARTKAKDLHVAPRRVRIAERGRDQNRYKAIGPAERQAIRGELGVHDPREFVLLAVGRQEQQKDYPTLLRAFDEAAGSEHPMRLLVAGREGAATPQLRSVVRSLHHRDQVHFLGQRDDIPNLLGAADAIACTSIREGAAGALIEAMGVGTPILSVPLDGLEGVLQHDDNALVVPRDQFAEGIVQMADNPELRRRLATSARSLFLERFTVERSAGSLADVYRWAASG